MAEEHIPEPGASPKDPELGEPAASLEIEGESALAAQARGRAEARDIPSIIIAPDAAIASVSDSPAKPTGLSPGQRLAAKKAAKAIDKRDLKEERKRTEEEARQKEQEEADRLLGRARPEPALPANVESAARTFSDFLQDNRERILIGVGAAAVIAAVAFGAQRFMRSGAAEQAAQLEHALELANAPLDSDDTDGKTDDGKPVFKGEQERAGKALVAFDQVVAGNPDSETAVWAKLAGASAEVALGKYDEARARFQKVYDAHVKEPRIAGRALEGVGIALEAAGKQDDALKAYEKLKYVEGEKELSDYHVARIKLAKGDREGGKALLKSLYDELSKPGEGSAPSRFLKSEVEVRLAEIDSTLVDKGSSIGGGGGEPQQFTEEQIQKLIQQMQQQGGKPGAGAE
ncbi:MAG: putative lipoprotein [Myxococcaceae bacterium]|nr:putative lipoprotein [Myxococcaceae bacterium]